MGMADVWTPRVCDLLRRNPDKLDEHDRFEITKALENHREELDEVRVELDELGLNGFDLAAKLTCLGSGCGECAACREFALREALVEMQEYLKGKHDGGVILPLRDMLDRALFIKERTRDDGS